MGAEAVGASVHGLHRNGGIWGLLSVRETPPPSDTGSMCGPSVTTVTMEADEQRSALCALTADI